MEIVVLIVCLFIFSLVAIGFLKHPQSVYRDRPEEKNPFEGQKVQFVESEADKVNADGVKGHLESIGTIEIKRNGYDIFCKRFLDVILSFFGLVLLSPIFLIVSILIVIDDPGPTLFSQKRVGKNKQFFQLHKFRSMKMSTPKEVPTHMLAHPQSYITRVGRILRKTSLDELPQLWDILIGNMSIIGPRPALWNQDLLTAERDKYFANECRPGLTGWAQINGRDEIEIPDKAKLDGEYVKKLQAGGIQAFLFDCKCFFGTILPVARGEGIVEGNNEIQRHKK